MQESLSQLSAGQAVVVRDERWTVLATERFDDVAMVTLRGGQDDNRDERLTVLTPADPVDLVPVSRRLRHRSRRAVLASVATALAEITAWDNCWTAVDARIDRRAWQLEPARAAVRGATRILLADAVGLGKTIQAALIITELRARGLAGRVLVLTPASIRDQWAAELSERFGLAPVVLDQPALAIAMASHPPGVNPWSVAPLIISSIDLVKRPEVRAALESIAFDVLVVDEAHHLTPGTDRGAVVAELAERTPWVVLATATPHGGDDTAFEFLQRLGDVGTEDLQTFRRSRRIGCGAAARRSRVLFVQPTIAERALLDAVRDYARALAAGRHPGRHLIASVVSRRAASSAQAVHATFRRRLALLARTVDPERQTVLPWEDDEADTLDDGVLGSPGLRSIDDEIAWLHRLIDLARAAQINPSKLGIIRRLLRRTTEPLLVFSEYRDVAQLVATALADSEAVAALHGAQSARERRHVVEAFNSGRVRVLVATDAAGEGLNLQTRCRFVVNLELPWTPRRLEQRIGRVDRIGQPRSVHAIHLAHRGTYEGTVIARLERRRARMRRGDDGVETIDLGTAPPARPAAPVVSGNGRVDSGGVYSSRAGLRTSRIRLAYLTTAVDATGRVIGRRVVALQILGAPPDGHRLSRTLVRQLEVSDLVARAVAPEVDRTASTASFQAVRTAAAVDRRLSAIVSRLDRLGATQPWQASLFDRRAEQRAHARQRSIADLRRHFGQRADRLHALTQVTTPAPRLIAAWLE